MAKLNTKSETTKLEQLILIVEMIDKVQRWLSEEERYLSIPESKGSLSKWLFESKTEWLERYNFKLKVKDRLVRYYANKCFNLYMSSEIIYTSKSLPVAQDFFKTVNKITDDYRVNHMENNLLKNRFQGVVE